MTAAPRHGWMAEFDSAAALKAAVVRLRAAGWHDIEVYSPFAVDGLAEALPPRAPNPIGPIARLMLIGALVGGIGTLALQWYASVHAYPLDIGGRPLASWPAFIPAALEMTFLFGALFGVVGMLVHAGLPRLYHPAFNVPRFAAASRDGFFVLVQGNGPFTATDDGTPRAWLERLGARGVYEVAP